MKARKGIPEFNFVILGNKGVGKTSLVQRFMNNTFSTSYLETNSVRKFTKVLDLKEKKSFDAEIAVLHIYDM